MGKSRGVRKKCGRRGKCKRLVRERVVPFDEGDGRWDGGAGSKTGQGGSVAESGVPIEWAFIRRSAFRVRDDSVDAHRLSIAHTPSV